MFHVTLTTPIREYYVVQKNNSKFDDRSAVPKMMTAAPKIESHHITLTMPLLGLFTFISRNRDC